MPPFIVAYAATAICFFALDFIWLSTATGLLYKPLLGSMLAPEPSLSIAALFYVFYVVGLVVFAVLPAANAGSWLMALGLGAGDELRRPLAITVIGGLTVATLLTLVVIPCLYRAMSGAKESGP